MGDVVTGVGMVTVGGGGVGTLSVGSGGMGTLSVGGGRVGTVTGSGGGGGGGVTTAAAGTELNNAIPSATPATDTGRRSRAVGVAEPQAKT
jgi:hypothetical protein